MRMSTGPRTAATLWVFSLLLLALRATAGPVTGDEAASAPMGSEAAPAGESGLTSPPLSGTGTASGQQGSGDVKPAGSALALELLKEAEAGAPANEAQRRAARPAAQTATAPAPSGPRSRSQATEAEADGGLREMGKAAVHWLKESLPWLRQDAEDDDRRHSALSGTADWSESPLEGGKGGRGGALMPADGVAMAPVGPDAAVGYGSSTRRTPDPQHNLIQEFLQVVRVVLEHPMTWLIVALFLVGGMAIRKFDRRPK